MGQLAPDRSCIFLAGIQGARRSKLSIISLQMYWKLAWYIERMYPRRIPPHYLGPYMKRAIVPKYFVKYITCGTDYHFFGLCQSMRMLSRLLYWSSTLLFLVWDRQPLSRGQESCSQHTCSLFTSSMVMYISETTESRSVIVNFWHNMHMTKGQHMHQVHSHGWM